MQVARNEGPPLSHQVTSLGPGIQGPVTRLPGRMAHFETCHLVESYERVERSYDVLASLNNSWLSYTTNALLGHFLDKLHENVSDTCLGIWNPHWDDFGNVCGEKRSYPLTRAIFRLYNDSYA
ncbi:hypothetical protein HPB48_000047 [Haemaphysalis longicornis]|uniref:Uncharacterized protein n=1 Tax=Haemaphysalis longicornis TaxID=44386 RepID=A0A9J6G7Z5_HAELO|nr:hypothetical protein HPB48_000047 [Haemaphysalis longicornis]